MSDEQVAREIVNRRQNMTEESAAKLEADIIATRQAARREGMEAAKEAAAKALEYGAEAIGPSDGALGRQVKHFVQRAAQIIRALPVSGAVGEAEPWAGVLAHLPRACHALEHPAAADPNGLVLYFNSDRDAEAFSQWLVSLPTPPRAEGE